MPPLRNGQRNMQNEEDDKIQKRHEHYQYDQTNKANYFERCGCIHNVNLEYICE